MGIKDFFYQSIGREVSRSARYMDCVIQWQPYESDRGSVLTSVENKNKLTTNALSEVEAKINPLVRTAVLLNGNINFDLNIEDSLANLKSILNRYSRVILIGYNPYLRFIYKLATYFRISKTGYPPLFVTRTNLEIIAKLAGFEIVRMRPIVVCPFKLLGIGSIINFFAPMIPLFKWFGLICVTHLRPVVPDNTSPSISILVPARNESGNIASAVELLPTFGGADREIIFVEGHSTDDTWQKIKETAARPVKNLTIKSYQQTGKGKSDAVRLGCAHAEKDLIVIWDADLTVSGKDLERFYFAFKDGHADFVNGSRLLYPMEADAMRFLNWLGNILFAKLLSFTLDCKLGDSLCGTKLFTKTDYQRMIAWRKDFGDVDPFGDFELLFPTAQLGLGSIDINVHYRARTYGATNILRFRHGLMLFKMVWIGLLKLKSGS